VETSGTRLCPVKGDISRSVSVKTEGSLRMDCPAWWVRRWVTDLIQARPASHGKAASEISGVLKSQPSGAGMPMGTKNVAGRTAMTGAKAGWVKM
jgi:hypothetical protein